MSYLVLARKYRPKRFSELVGQPHVARTLLNGLRQGRVAHAYLFSGPRGVGKTTTARLLARAINCLHPLDGEPCGKCPPCTSIGEGRALDVIEIDAASNNGVDDIRLLREGINYVPVECRAKVYIIDEVHMLSIPAFNALLKTLEEPPEHSYFYLATTAPQKVPATILSRCQRFDFRRVSTAEIRAHLEFICKSEQLPYDQAALEIVARRADGSVRDSLSIADQVIAFAGGRLLKQDAIEAVGEVRLDLYFKALDLVESRNLTQAFALDEELSSSGADPQNFLVGLQNHLIQVLHTKTLGAEKVDVPQDSRSEFTRFAARLTEADLIRLLQYCAAAEVDVRRNFNPRVRLQLLLLKFASFDQSVVLGDLIQRLESGQVKSVSSEPLTASARPQKSSTSSLPGSRKSQSAEPPPATAPVTAPSASPPKTASDAELLSRVQSAWSEICAAVSKEHNSRARMLQLGGYPTAFRNRVLTVNFAKSFDLDAVRGCIPSLQKELIPLVGEVQVELALGPIPQSSHDEESESDPVLNLLKERLDAKPIN